MTPAKMTQEQWRLMQQPPVIPSFRMYVYLVKKESGKKESIYEIWDSDFSCCQPVPRS
jgi:hypothetical protein